MRSLILPTQSSPLMNVTQTRVLLLTLAHFGVKINYQKGLGTRCLGGGGGGLAAR